MDFGSSDRSVAKTTNVVQAAGTASLTIAVGCPVTSVEKYSVFRAHFCDRRFVRPSVCVSLAKRVALIFIGLIFFQAVSLLRR